MFGLPDYCMPSDPVLHEPDWSRTAEAAFEVANLVKKAKVEISWFATADICKKSSQAIATRWHYLKQIAAKLRAPGDQHSAPMMLRIEQGLQRALEYIDEANVAFEGADDIRTLQNLIEEYGDVIIAALKGRMDPDEQERFDDNRDFY